MSQKTFIFVVLLNIVILCQCNESGINDPDSSRSPTPDESANYEHHMKAPEDSSGNKDPKKMQIVYIKLPLLHVLPENQLQQGRSSGDNIDNLNPSESYRQEASTEPESGINHLADESSTSNQYSSNNEADVSLDFSNSPSPASPVDNNEQFSVQNNNNNNNNENNEPTQATVGQNSLQASLPRRHIYQPEVHGHFVGPLMGVEEGEKKLQNKPHMNLGILPIIIQIDDNGKLPEITHAQVLRQANTFLGRGQKMNNFIQRNGSKSFDTQHGNGGSIGSGHHMTSLSQPSIPFTPGYTETMSIKPFGMQPDLSKLNNQFWKNLIQTANNHPAGNSPKSGGAVFWNNVWSVSPSSGSKNNNNNNNKDLSLSPIGGNNIQPYGMYGNSAPFLNQYGSVFDWFDAGQSSKMLQQALSSNTNINFEPAPLPMVGLPSTMPSSSSGQAPMLLFRNSPTRQKLRNSGLLKSAKSLFSSFSSKGVAGQASSPSVSVSSPHHKQQSHHRQTSLQGHSNANNGVLNNAGLLFGAHYGQANNNFNVHNGNLPVLESNLFPSISPSQSSSPCRRPVRPSCSSIGSRHKTPTLHSAAMALLSSNSIVRKSLH